VLHADLYRLRSARDLDELGLFDDPRAIVLIEWPERAEGVAGRATMTVSITVPPDHNGRVAEIVR
jgi:tRNA A37 threonylcarbamoyladenosine biosynthesis protein TsaE